MDGLQPTIDIGGNNNGGWGELGRRLDWWCNRRG